MASTPLALAHDTKNEEPIVTDRPATRDISHRDPAWEAFRHPAGWRYHYINSAGIVTDTRRGTFSPVAQGLKDIEVYYGNEGCRWIDHGRQAAYTKAIRSEPPLEPTFFEQQQYWDYVASHPSHYSDDVLLKIVLEGGRQALDYLEWCSQAALLPCAAPTAQFSLRYSKDLIELLSNLRNRYISQTQITHIAHSSVEHITISTGDNCIVNWFQTKGGIQPMDQSVSISIPGVLVSTIAGILAKKYTSYSAKGFWKEDRNVFLESHPSTSEITGGSIFHGSFIGILTIICLFAPKRYMRVLLDVDSSFLTGDDWRGHVQKLTDNWTAYNLLATVILAASVSMLSFSTLGSIAKVAALNSVLLSLGSVMTGLHCLAYYRAYLPSVDSDDGIVFADRYKGNITGHGQQRPKYFAVILSLPEVFLLWSIMSMIVAALAFNFGGGPWTFGVFWVLGVFVVVGVGFGVVLILQWYVWGKGSIQTRVRRFISRMNRGGRSTILDGAEERNEERA